MKKSRVGQINVILTVQIQIFDFAVIYMEMVEMFIMIQVITLISTVKSNYWRREWVQGKFKLTH